MNQSDTKKLTVAMEKNPGAGRLTLAKLTGINPSAVRRFLKSKEREIPVAEESDAEPTGVLPTVSVTDVLSQHDVAGKAVQMLRGIKAGQLVADETLRRALGASHDRWAHAKKSAALAGFFTVLPDKKMMWGKKDTISALVAQMRDLI